MSSSAANKPSDLEAQFQGEVRNADGYAYWTTSQEDEEALDIREIVDSGGKPPKKVVKKKLFKPGVGRRIGIRIAAFLLITILVAIAYFVFNLVQVQGAADDNTVQESDVIVVLGAAQNNGDPSGVLRERLDHALNLRDQGLAPVIMTTGAGQEGETFTEGLAGTEYLERQGLEKDKEVITIAEGTNTYEQLSASLEKMQEEGFESVILVSDGYHNYRLLQIADELGMENVTVSPSGVEPTVMNYVRESAAVSIGRITGYDRLSAFTEDG